jgi:hypothetical protein
MRPKRPRHPVCRGWFDRGRARALDGRACPRTASMPTARSSDTSSRSRGVHRACLDPLCAHARSHRQREPMCRERGPERLRSSSPRPEYLAILRLFMQNTRFSRHLPDFRGKCLAKLFSNGRVPTLHQNTSPRAFKRARASYRQRARCPPPCPRHNPWTMYPTSSTSTP